MAITTRPQLIIIGSALNIEVRFLPILLITSVPSGDASMWPIETIATKVEASEAVIGIGESGAISFMMLGEFHPMTLPTHIAMIEAEFRESRTV